MNRRDFLSLCAALPMTALFEAGRARASGLSPRTLVLVELKGGNDGINTLVPYADAGYAAARSTLRIDSDQLLKLSEQVGLNPALEPLMDAWDAGELALVQGVGYEAPNRSHFRSMEIWYQATDSDQVGTEGWLAQVLSGEGVAAGFAADALVLGQGAGPAAGSEIQTLVLQDVDTLIARAGDLPQVAGDAPNAALAHILDVMAGIRASADTLESRLAQVEIPEGSFPTTAFGADLEQAARLVLADAAPVVHVELGSFDTHNQQRATHDRLLSQLAEGLAALRAVLMAQGRWDDTLVLTHSEFGRRVAENGTQGTDHGTAGVHLFLGGGVSGGLHGAYPSLTDLDGNGDLLFSVDYRSLYNTVIVDWWGLSDRAIDPGRFPALPVLKG